MNSEITDEAGPALLAFLADASAHAQVAPARPPAAEGEVAGISYRVHGSGPPLVLFIDFKSPPEQTYPALRRTLAGYADMLTTWRDDVINPGAVTVILTRVARRELAKVEKDRE